MPSVRQLLFEEMRTQNLKAPLLTPTNFLFFRGLVAGVCTTACVKSTGEEVDSIEFFRFLEVFVLYFHSILSYCSKSERGPGKLDMRVGETTLKVIDSY